MADLPRFQFLMQQHSERYDHFTASVCLKKDDGGYQIVFGKLLAERRGTQHPISEALDFGEYVYTKGILQLDELEQILQEQTPTLRIGRYEFSLKDASLRYFGGGRLPSNNWLTDSPAEVFELRPASHANYFNPASLVAHDCPRIFHDQYDGIRQFIGTNISVTYNSGLIGALLLVMPDYRISIIQILGRDHTLRVELRKDQSFVGARLHCLVEGGQCRQELIREIDSEDISLQLQCPVETLEIVRLFITNAADGTLDWYEQVPTFHSGATRWISSERQEPEEDIVTHIKNGEGPQLELKSYVKKGEKKAAEIVRAAIAFANTSGGTIYLGVNNWLEIEGIENDLKKEYHTGDVMTAANRYANELSAMLNEATSRRLELTSQVLTIEGHIVLRLHVAEWKEEKPIWDVHTREAWTRVRSNNVRADPDTIRGFMQDRTFVL